MINYKIWVTLPDASQVLAGKLLVEIPDQRADLIQAQFQYDSRYLMQPYAFSLDPINLPLVEGPITSARTCGGIHAAFEDSLPDDWGKKLLIKQYKLNRQQQLAPYLLGYLHGRQLGALSFTQQKKPSPLKSEQISVMQLQNLLQVADDFERGNKIDDLTMQALFEAGSSPGGARPKVLVGEGEHHWLVKFPSIKDDYAIIPLEAASLKLAMQAKLMVMEHRQQKCSNKSILLIKRFDITEKGGRRHMLSFKTLLRAEGFYFLSYVDMAQCIQKISTHVQRDLSALYRQMVFNILLGNTDDHLKNFAMLHDENGWFLSPAFDLLPNIGGNTEHALRFHYYEYLPQGKEILSLGQYFSLTESQARQIFNEVYQSITHWQPVFSECNVPQLDQDRLANDIRNRLQRYHSI